MVSPPDVSDVDMAPAGDHQQELHETLGTQEPVSFCEASAQSDDCPGCRSCQNYHRILRNTVIDLKAKLGDKKVALDNLEKGWYKAIWRGHFVHLLTNLNLCSWKMFCFLSGMCL